MLGNTFTHRLGILVAAYKTSESVLDTSSMATSQNQCLTCQRLRKKVRGAITDARYSAILPCVVSDVPGSQSIPNLAKSVQDSISNALSPTYVHTAVPSGSMLVALTEVMALKIGFTCFSQDRSKLAQCRDEIKDWTSSRRTRDVHGKLHIFTASVDLMSL